MSKRRQAKSCYFKEIGRKSKLIQIYIAQNDDHA